MTCKQNNRIQQQQQHATTCTLATTKIPSTRFIAIMIWYEMFQNSSLNIRLDDGGFYVLLNIACTSNVMSWR